MITHHREWRPQTRDEWWSALKEGDQWAKDNGWMVSSAWGHLPIEHGEGNSTLGYLSVIADEAIKKENK